MTSLSKVSIYLSILSPLLIFPNFFFPFVSGKIIFFRVAIELAFLFFILHFVFSRNFWEELSKIRSRLKNPIFLSIAAFTGVFLLTALVGINPQHSFWSNYERGEGAFQMIHYFLFFALVFLLFTDKKEILDLLKFNFGVSALISLYTLAQRLISWGLISSPILGFLQIYGVEGSGAAASGTLGNTSYLSTYLLMSIVMGLFLLLKTEKIRWKIFLAGVLIFEGLILWQTQTRGVFLGILIGLIAFLVVNIFVVKQSIKARPYLIVFLILLIAFPIIFFLTKESILWQKFPQIKNLANPETLNYRLWTWGSAIAGFIERPILGWGAENFPYVFDKYYNAKHYGIESFFDRAHNIFLDHLINGGAMLLIVYLSIFYFYYRALFKLEKNLGWSILFALSIAYLIQGFFLFEVLVIYLTLFLFLAFFINFFWEKPIEFVAAPAFSLKKSLIGLAMTALAVLVIFFGSYLPLKKNLLLQKGFYGATEKLAGRIESYYNAITFPSPVGREEALAVLFNSSINYLRLLEKRGAAPPMEVVNVLMKLNNEQFDSHEKEFVGIRNRYLNGFLNLEAANLTKDVKYLDRGKALFKQGLEVAPTRLELIMPLVDVYKFENNQEELNIIKAKIKLLRPDLFEKLGKDYFKI